MTKMERMLAQARLATALSAARAGVLAETPFADLLRATRFDLERVAVPVVGVTGGFSSGKSTLINAFCGAKILPTGVTPTTHIPIRVRGGAKWSCMVGSAKGESIGPSSKAELAKLVTNPGTAQYIKLELPEAKAVPWAWLDMPGTNVDGAFRPAPLQAPAALVDHAVLLTSALQPMPMTDLRHVLQLADQLPNQLTVAVSRTDLLNVGPAQQQVIEYVQRILRASGESRTLHVLACSSIGKPGIADLSRHLASTLCELQYERLKSEVDGWSRQLLDLKKLLRMGELAAVRVETITALQPRLVAAAMGRLSDIKRQLPSASEVAVTRLSSSLPSTRREIHTGAASLLTSDLNAALEALGRDLQVMLVQALERDITSRAAQEIVQHVGTIWRVGSPTYFAGSSAAIGAGFGVALGTLAPPAGLLIGGLVGGLLGGLLGDGEAVTQAAVVRDEVVKPVMNSLASEIDKLAGILRAELENFCQLMTTAVRTYQQNHSKSDLRMIEKMLPAAGEEAKKMSADLLAVRSVEITARTTPATRK